jgi:hypothetical protein
MRKDWSKAATIDTQLEKRHTRYCMPAAGILIGARLLTISCRMATMLSIPVPFHKRSLHSQRPAKVAHTLAPEPP